MSMPVLLVDLTFQVHIITWLLDIESRVSLVPGNSC